VVHRLNAGFLRRCLWRGRQRPHARARALPRARSPTFSQESAGQIIEEICPSPLPRIRRRGNLPLPECSAILGLQHEKSFPPFTPRAAFGLCVPAPPACEFKTAVRTGGQALPHSGASQGHWPGRGCDSLARCGSKTDASSGFPSNRRDRQGAPACRSAYAYAHSKTDTETDANTRADAGKDRQG